jgi:ribosomal-protein-alanine N-acetyltransferase
MNAQIKELPLFRPMRMEDVDAVMSVEAQVYPFPWTPGNFLDSVNVGYSCWVYEQGDALIGYGVMMVAVAAGEAHLLNIAVAPEWQGKGMGRRMLQQLIRVAREHRTEYMYLEVRPSNLPARRLYVGVGFKEIGWRKNYYPALDGREDAVIMGLDL